jgi:hypothetical protein
LFAFGTNPALDGDRGLGDTVAEDFGDSGHGGFDCVGVCGCWVSRCFTQPCMLRGR